MRITCRPTKEGVACDVIEDGLSGPVKSLWHFGGLTLEEAKTRVEDFLLKRGRRYKDHQGGRRRGE